MDRGTNLALARPAIARATSAGIGLLFGFLHDARFVWATTVVRWFILALSGPEASWNERVCIVRQPRYVS